ncbi:MAG: aldehyde dehydrogenase (NAD+) [Thermoproteota archaeon]|jgi:aldehyde dehydrogenase (NAD+)
MKIKELVQTQRDYFFTHRTKSYQYRKQALVNLKSTIIELQDEIFQALESDLNKSNFETYATELGFILEELTFSIKHLKEWMQVKKVSTPSVLLPGSSRIYHDAYGVVLLIGPWNYPFQLVMGPLIGAIAGGNTVVIKPSEYASATSAIIKKIVERTFQDEYVCVVEGAVKETQELLKEKFDHIFFTGSTQVGKEIMKAASEFLTPVTLELGGKSPCIVDKDINIAVTAKRIIWGKTINAGQTCIAPDYLFVHESIKDQLVAEMEKVIAEFYPGRIKDSPDYTRIINERHFDRIVKLLENETVLVGGVSDKESLFIEPTLIDVKDSTSPIMKEEIFGPLLPIMTFSDLPEVTKFINNRAKPLSLYVFSNNEDFQNKILAYTTAGGVCINDTLVHAANPHLPFGGVGESGVGSYHGKFSFDTFTHQKAVIKKSVWPDIPIRYAPYKDKIKFLKIFFK